MEKQIIDGPMNVDERLELEKYMYNDIKDSIEKEGNFRALHGTNSAHLIVFTANCWK